jgi:carbon-monoxide dehydrogenase small subunit
MDMQKETIEINVNGSDYTLDVWPHHTLLQVLRDQLHFTGPKECCAEGECGACTVLLDGRALNACLMLAVEADGSQVLTIEGLAEGDKLDPLQEAFLEESAAQCGFCTPGMILSAKYLLMNNPHPSREEIKEGLAGNLCRCGSYVQIIEAVESAAREGV